MRRLLLLPFVTGCLAATTYNPQGWWVRVISPPPFSMLSTEVSMDDFHFVNSSANPSIVKVEFADILQRNDSADVFTVCFAINTAPFFPCHNAPFRRTLTFDLPIGRYLAGLYRVDVVVRMLGFPDTVDTITTWLVKPPDPAVGMGFEGRAMAAGLAGGLRPWLPPPSVAAAPLPLAQPQDAPVTVLVVIADAPPSHPPASPWAKTCSVVTAALSPDASAVVGRRPVQVTDVVVASAEPARWQQCLAGVLPQVAVTAAPPASVWRTLWRYAHPDTVAHDFVAYVNNPRAAPPPALPALVADCTAFHVDVCQAAPGVGQGASLQTWHAAHNFEFVWQRNRFYDGITTEWVMSPVVAVRHGLKDSPWRCAWGVLHRGLPPCEEPGGGVCGGEFGATLGATCGAGRTALMYRHTVDYDAWAAATRGSSAGRHQVCIGCDPGASFTVPALLEVFSGWRRFGLFGERAPARPLWPSPCPGGDCRRAASHVLGAVSHPQHFCFVLWPSSARYLSGTLVALQTVGLQLVMVRALDVPTRSHAVDQMWRFYAPDGHVMHQHMVSKAATVGTGTMYVIVVRDPAPVYISQLAVSGPHAVNTKVTNMKGHMRETTGGEFHASMNAREGMRDALSFLGFLPWCMSDLGVGAPGPSADDVQAVGCSHQAGMDPHGARLMPAVDTWVWTTATYRAPTPSGQTLITAVSPKDVAALVPAGPWRVPGDAGNPWRSVWDALRYLNVSVPFAVVLPPSAAGHCVQLKVDTSGGSLDPLCPAAASPGMRHVTAMLMVQSTGLASIALGSTHVRDLDWGTVPCCTPGQRVAPLAAAAAAEIVQVHVAGAVANVAVVEAGQGFDAAKVPPGVQYHALKHRECNTEGGLCYVELGI